MKWLALAVGTVACVVLHTTVGPRLAIGQVRPDLLVVFVVFIAMHVRGVDVIAAACAVGMVADLQSIERFGVLALAYAAAAGVVYALRNHVFRSHPLAHFAMTFGAECVIQLLLLVYYGLVGGVGGETWGAQVLGGLLIALYSAALAPPVHALLLRMAPWVGVDVPRYAQAGMGRIG